MDGKSDHIDPTLLSGFVKEIFSFQSHNSREEKVFKYYADGLPGIMFQQSENGMYLNEKKLSPLFLYGQTIKPIEISAKGTFRMIIFYLYPDMVKALFNIDASELTDTCRDFDSLEFEGAKDLSQKMLSMYHIEEQVQALQKFILERGVRPSKALDLPNAIKKIELQQETFSISSISDQFNVSPRTFQRIFKEFVGVSPRLYLRISKFNKAVNQLEAGEFRLLTELAYDAEYSDQSHFIRTFKEFTGLTPKAFVSRLKANQNEFRQ